MWMKSVSTRSVPWEQNDTVYHSHWEGFQMYYDLKSHIELTNKVSPQQSQHVGHRSQQDSDQGRQHVTMVKMGRQESDLEIPHTIYRHWEIILNGMYNEATWPLLTPILLLTSFTPQVFEFIYHPPLLLTGYVHYQWSYWVIGTGSLLTMLGFRTWKRQSCKGLITFQWGSHFGNTWFWCVNIMKNGSYFWDGLIGMWPILGHKDIQEQVLIIECQCVYQKQQNPQVVVISQKTYIHILTLGLLPLVI